MPYKDKNKQKEYMKLYVQNHKEKLNLQYKKYRNLHKSQITLIRKKHRALPEIKILRREYQKKYIQERIKKDLSFKLSRYLRVRIYNALKGINKSLNIIELIGCSIEQLKNHLENQFKEGMSWNNYGKWHVDHIIPCASFDLSKISEQLKCFNYQNLQPLWAFENINKNAKIELMEQS